MFGTLRIADQINGVRLADFLERPARAHVADKATGELRDPAEGGDGWQHITVSVAISKQRTGAVSSTRRHEPEFQLRSLLKCRTSLSSAPFQPRSWLARDASVRRRECVKVSSVPV